NHKETLVAIEKDKEAMFTSVEFNIKKDAEKTKTLADLRKQLVKQFFNIMLNARLDEIRQSPNPPFVYGGSGFGGFVRNKGSYSMFGETDPNNIKKALTALLTENKRALVYGFTQPEFERQKQSLLTFLENQFKEKDKTESRRFADNYVYNYLENYPVPGIEFQYNFSKNILPTITLEEINALAKETISQDNRVIIITGSDKEGVKYPTESEVLALIKESENLEVKPYTETVATEPLVKELPQTAQISEEKKDDKFGLTYLKLSNGINVVIKPTDFKADEIVMRGFSPGGLSLVSDEKALSGLFLGQVLSESGVKKLSKVELNKMLAGKKASASIGINELFETITGSSTPKDFEAMLQLAYLGFMEANLDKNVFDSFISKQKMFLPSLMANPQFYFSSEVSKIMSQNHPRAFDTFDPKTLDKVKFEDIQAIYKDRFADASDFTFIFVGNIDIAQAKPLITKYLGNLPSINRKETGKDLGMRSPKGSIEKVINKGVDDKSLVQITFTGEAKYDLVENRHLTALGELLTIKLIEILREEKGGVYGVGASGRMSKLPYEQFSFNINFPCGAENTESLIKATLDEIKKIQNGQIDEKDIAKVKEARIVRTKEEYKQNNYWLGVIYGNLTTNNQILTFEETQERINSINKEDMQKVAQKYLKLDKKLQFILMPEKK
ncbi:MAG: insulinase family protein, partial [Pyrinomonadaceae bacterium]|nr:insulinase family protein [Pyrinomonadaceae bacterium]